MSCLRILTAIFLLGFCQAHASDLDFQLSNQTDRSFEAIYITSSKDEDWSGNLLKANQILEAKGMITVTFAPSEKSATWDVKVVDDEGVAVTFKSVNLINVDKITLESEGGRYTAEVE